VDKILDLIDKDKKIFKHRLYQDHCTLITHETEDIKDYVKILDGLGRDLKKTVLVDTKYLTFWPNPDNCIPVKEYTGSKKECFEMLTVIELLESLKAEEDVRKTLDEKYLIRRT